MQQTFTFDEPFQLKVLGLLHTGALSLSQVQPTCFFNPIFAEICASIILLRTQYGDATPAMIEAHLLRKDLFKDREYQLELQEYLADVFHSIPATETQYVTDLVDEFVRFHAYEQRLKQGIELLQRQDPSSLSGLDALFAQPVASNGYNKPSGDFYFSSFAERLERRRQVPDVLKTFIPPLDLLMSDGGIVRQNMTLIAGLTTQGKTFFLGHVALAAVIQKKKTWFISLEMTTDQIEARFDAALSGVKTRELRGDAEKVRESLAWREQAFGDILYVEKMRGATTVARIRERFQELVRQGFRPEVVILDYLNRMRPAHRSPEGHYRDLGSVVEDYTNFAEEENLWPFLGAQINRQGFKADLLTSEHMGGTFEGAQIAHNIFTINRTREEADQNKLRIYVDKARTDEAQKIIPISTDYARGQFYTRRERV